jgi:hypothetical protein
MLPYPPADTIYTSAGSHISEGYRLLPEGFAQHGSPVYTDRRRNGDMLLRRISPRSEIPPLAAQEQLSPVILRLLEEIHRDRELLAL